MLTRGAISDIVAAHLFRETGRAPAAAPSKKKVPELKKKVFLTDRELRLLLSPDGRQVTVPANAILSPLALDWLEFNAVKIVRR